MNVELKEVQVVFYDSEIIIHFPSWYHLKVEKMQVISANDIQPNHYGIAINNSLLYVLISKFDSDTKKIIVVPEPTQVEHIKPNHFNSNI